MFWLQMVLWATFAILVAYVLSFTLQVIYLVIIKKVSFDLLLHKSRWQIKVLPYFLLLILNVTIELPTNARWILMLHLVLIFIYIPVHSYLTPLKSLLIKLYSPKIVHQQADLKVSINDNHWDAVKLIRISSMLAQFWKKSVTYIGLIIIPDLKMAVAVKTITLMTCTDDNHRRILVQASLVKRYLLAEADKELRNYILKMK